MKKSLIALAVLVAAFGAQAEYIGTSAANSNGVVSSSAATAYSNGNGASLSSAGNFQYADSTASATASKFTAGPLQSGTAGVAGTAVTATGSYAGNISTGNASGAAGAGGVSLVNAGSSAYYDKHAKNPSGSTSGNVSSIAESGVSSGTNGLAYAGGVNTAGYTGLASSTKLGNTDSKLTNVALTNANAASVSVSGSGHIGNATVDNIHVEGVANAVANAKSGNVISSN